MCKAWEDAQKKAAIRGFIDSGREFGIAEDEIKEKIMSKYCLTEEEAKEYMIKKSA